MSKWVELRDRTDEELRAFLRRNRGIVKRRSGKISILRRELATAETFVTMTENEIKRRKEKPVG